MADTDRSMTCIPPGLEPGLTAKCHRELSLGGSISIYLSPGSALYHRLRHESACMNRLLCFAL